MFLWQRFGFLVLRRINLNKRICLICRQFWWWTKIIVIDIVWFCLVLHIKVSSRILLRHKFAKFLNFTFLSRMIVSFWCWVLSNLYFTIIHFFLNLLSFLWQCLFLQEKGILDETIGLYLTLSRLFWAGQFLSEWKWLLCIYQFALILRKILIVLRSCLFKLLH